MSWMNGIWQWFLSNVQALAAWRDQFDWLQAVDWWLATQSVWEHGRSFILGIVLGIVLYGLLALYLRTLHRQEGHLKNLWDLSLMLLVKRQMSIPIIYTLAKHQKLLPPPELEGLLSVRENCRETSLRHDRRARMKQESVLSQTLFHFFLKLEKINPPKTKSAVAQLGREFEFIDEKLIQLQRGYNAEVDNWNNRWKSWWQRPLLWLLRFAPHQHFS